MIDELESWIERQYRVSATGMLRSVSAVDLVKTRPGFGQTIRPRRGSVIASPVLGAYDPDPDYFFHWFRDSAIVIDALRLLREDGTVGTEALSHLEDFVHFSHTLDELDGRRLVSSSAWRARVAPDFTRHLRADADLASVHGAGVVADTRVNPDATLDISKWARPQYDGAALRALMLLRWRGMLERTRAAGAGARDEPTRHSELDALLRADLAFTRRHWREPCFDVWEEENGRHYYTLRVGAAALSAGAAWLQSRGEADMAQECRADAQSILESLDHYWLADPGYYRSRVLIGDARSAKELDIAVILATLHAGATGERHSVHDPRVQATLAHLEQLFDSEYPINHHRPAGRGPALGRYPDDRYYSGGAYYFSTLAGAEFCFRASIGAADSAAWRARGDAYLQTVRAFTPADGALSEQFDRTTGQQTSAKQLAWSYAAFISCAAARRAAAVA